MSTRYPVRNRALAIGAIGVMLVACGSDDETASTTEVTTGGLDVATVVYDFHGAAVAPEYYRSYTLTITPTEATLVVSDASEVLHEETATIDDTLWSATRDAALDVAEAPDVTTVGCAGGTSDELSVTDTSGAEIAHVAVDHCGETAVSTDLAGTVSGALALFDLDALLA